MGTRARLIRTLTAKLRAYHFPRVQMFFVVALSAAFGWLSSFVLLHAGVTSMAARYPMALLCAYLFFLLLLWIWMRTTAQRLADATDVIDAVTDLPFAHRDTNAGSHFDLDPRLIDLLRGSASR